MLKIKTKTLESDRLILRKFLLEDADDMYNNWATDAVVEMTLGDSVKNVYASKYLTYLPTKEELIKIIRDEKEIYELSKEEGVKNE